MTGRRREARILALILLALFAAPVTSGAQEAPDAAAQGATQPTDLRVTVQDEAGAPVAGQEVVLVVSNGREVTDELTATSDDQGDALFAAVAVGAGYTARPVALSEGFPQQGERVTLTPGVATTLPLTITSVSDAPAMLHISVLHIILNVLEPGLYQGLQVMSVLNVGDRPAYSGEDLDGRPVGMIIPLPDAATLGPALPPEVGGLDPERLAQDGNRLLDLRPVPPGQRQVAVQYEIVTDPAGGDIAITVPHPTQEISVLLGPGLGTVTIDSDQLRANDPVTIEGQGEYASYASDVLAAGDTLRFRIGPDSPPLSVAAWSLLALAVALLASAAASIAFSRPAPPDPGARQALIAEVARLDEQHAAGALDHVDYHARRGEAITRLMELDGAPPGALATPAGRQDNGNDADAGGD